VAGTYPLLVLFSVRRVFFSTYWKVFCLALGISWGGSGWHLSTTCIILCKKGAISTCWKAISFCGPSLSLSTLMAISECCS